MEEYPIMSGTRDQGSTTDRPLPSPTGSLVPAVETADRFAEELRRLLRSRLVLVHLLSLASISLLAILSLLVPGDDPLLKPDLGYSWTFAIPLTQCLLGAIILSRRPGMSIRALRGWELFHFGVMATEFALLRYVTLTFAANRVAGPSAGAGPSAVIGLTGMATLQGFLTLILAYGALIPNNRGRSLTVIAALSVIPFAIILAAVQARPEALGEHAAAMLVQCALGLVFPAGIGVFVATRTSALQRQAFEAERRSEQIAQYTLKRRVGRGAMGEVWLAEHALLKRPCAIKFIRPELAANPLVAARFAREVQAVTGLSHANTIRVYDYGQSADGSFYFVMEFLDGPTLEQLVLRSGPLDPARAIHLLRQLCGALGEAHQGGLVHRDLKPGNVIITTLGGQRDVVKLLDFGLVQDLSGDRDGRLTITGAILGTPAYMSPEQAAGSEVVDARGDVYGLGALAFFLLTGRPPFSRRTIGEYLFAHCSEIPPAVGEIRPGTPDDLSAVVARCLEKEPARRFGSALELEQALAGCECAGNWSAERARAWWEEGAGRWFSGTADPSGGSDDRVAPTLTD